MRVFATKDFLKITVRKTYGSGLYKRPTYRPTERLSEGKGRLERCSISKKEKKREKTIQNDPMLQEDSIIASKYKWTDCLNARGMKEKIGC